jgi:hypothetical protein
MGIRMQPQTFRVLLGAMFLATSPVASQTYDSASSQPLGAADRVGSLPPGWTARPDDAGQLKAIRFVAMEPGYHLTPGPATILYRAEDRVRGPFHTLATFHQMKKPPHPEGYGLFLGGQDLSGKSQSYTYFLVRGDGTYLIKQRKGDQTSEVTKGWTASSAVKKEDGQGKATNLLEIDAKRDPSKVEFKVNGQTVYSSEAGQLQLLGIVGIRANHHLDLRIEGFAIHQ